MEFKSILVEKNENIASIIINRPKKLNALNKEVKTEISKALDEFEKNIEIKVIIFSGSGPKAFISGDDITEFEHRTKADFRLLQDLTTRIEQFNKITIASIDGYALGGGCEIALSCDFRIATNNSKFGFPEITLGLIPGAGGSQRLPRLIGKSKALELIVTGDIIDANTALKIGLINQIVKPNELEEITLLFAKKIASKNLRSIQVAKELINYTVDNDIKTGLKKELDSIWELAETEESKEKVRNFLKK